MKHPELERTVEFVEMFNHFFDCLNVRRGKRSAVCSRGLIVPILSTEFRYVCMCICSYLNIVLLKWLEEVFLGYLERWEKAVEARPNFSATERNNMMLSLATRTGLKLTSKTLQLSILYYDY